MCDRPVRIIQIVVLLLLVAASACSPSPEINERAFVADIEQFRTIKNEAMEAPDSPIPPARRRQLLPLAYFAPSIDYRVPASLTASTDHTTIQMPTSTGQLRQMIRVGRLGFTLKGQQFGLTAFVEAGSPTLDRLFVPFTDMTSGTETYPAGRYLDLDRTPTGLYIVDFNRAYQPYCYYNPTYDCPYPPRENRLRVPIRAGEKMKNAVAPVAATR